MDDGDGVRELIGRVQGAQRQGFHVTPGALKIVLAALRFYLAARTWLAKPHADPRDDVARRKASADRYAGPPRTIAETRSHGVVACDVQCAGPNCWHTRRFTFDELGFPDAAAFIDIPRLQRFRCQRCGCRQVRISAD